MLGDIIMAIDGQPITNTDDYLSLLEQHKPGDLLLISTELNGQQREYQVRLAEPQ